MVQANLKRVMAITQLANRLLRKVEIAKPPISTDILKANHPELQIRSAALGRVSSALKISDPVSEKESEATAIIYFNDHESIPRQRFSICHEYGHYLLHHLGMCDSSETPRPLDQVLLEREADIFASSLLVPIWLLDGHAPTISYRDQDRESLEKLTLKLASAFNVSRPCMSRAMLQLHHMRKAYG